MQNSKISPTKLTLFISSSSGFSSWTSRHARSSRVLSIASLKVIETIVHRDSPHSIAQNWFYTVLNWIKMSHRWHGSVLYIANRIIQNKMASDPNSNRSKSEMAEELCRVSCKSLKGHLCKFLLQCYHIDRSLWVVCTQQNQFIRAVLRYRPLRLGIYFGLGCFTSRFWL